MAMWEEWLGLGNWLGRPVRGLDHGFHGLEFNFKAKWRTHFSKAQKQQFSRIKNVISGICAASAGRDFLEVVAEYEPLFQEMKQSPARLLQHFKDQGLVNTQKPRGYHVEAAN